MAMTNVYTGANGALLFFGDPANPPEGADADALMDNAMYAISELGRVSDVSLCVQTHLQEYHEVGARHATSLHPGDIHISGKIGRAYINGALLHLLLGRGANNTQIAEPYPQPAMTMSLILQDPAVPGTRSVIHLEGVKFENWAFAMPQDDFVMENVSFKALRVRVQDEEAASPGGARAVKTPNFPELAQ